MPKVAIIRRVYLLPGREADGIGWLVATEPGRRQAGQLGQWVLRGQIDTHEYQFVQVWRDEESYQAWRRSDDRRRLNADQGRFVTYDPTRRFVVLE